ncbi:HAMP domain-containing sensor histidine kinase [Terriglobus sp. TAA 43]|uniref:sensor histidine kinase n=1 Tax=Terriglobus sp. TAA 43 TaxID=278961 RepID=UPI000647561A|nr:HAMP domain-containing sensor histidine kinase [Terriglobus sp. TAA 43]
MPSDKHTSGIRTRLLLQISVACIVAATLLLSMLVVRGRLREHARETLQTDLQHSIQTFQDLQARQRTALQRENTLLAALPTLRALMIARDTTTISDGARDFWRLSGNDLFALADQDGRVLATYSTVQNANEELSAALQKVLFAPGKHYLTSGGNLFEFAVTPIYFGAKESGTLLGYVIGGYRIDHELLQEVGRGAGAEAIFLVDHRVAASTLPDVQQNALLSVEASQRTAPVLLQLNGQRYLAASSDLSSRADVPVHLVVLKSLVAVDRAEAEIRSVILFAGLLSIGVGCVLMLLLARSVTAPLERLASAVQAFAEGNRDYVLPSGGPKEVRFLSATLAEMREEIQRKNSALLESERLATIGRMANSVSHDLRHYLAAIYANSEFLASPTMPPEERAELFEEIRLAVNGTTDMLDALLLFGNTGSSLRRSPSPVAAVVERSMLLVRSHPDAERVTFKMVEVTADTFADIDARQVERAIYNLLLNASQAASEADGVREVAISITGSQDAIAVTVRDSGPGVPDGIRHSLFDPFVSKGKQKGTGLGLTLAHSVAQEHDGSVELVSSRPGETIFRLTLQRHSQGVASQTPHIDDLVIL